MQIVIEISEDYYNILKYEVEHGNDYVPIKLIANGTPLPPHNRLVDTDAVIEWLKDKDIIKMSYQENNVREDMQKSIPTILEANENE